MRTLKKKWLEIWGEIESFFREKALLIEGLYRSKLGWLLPAGPLIKGLLFIKDNWEIAWRIMKTKAEQYITPINDILKAADKEYGQGHGRPSFGKVPPYRHR